MKETNTITGVFILRDSDGNELVNKHNMIVKSGRKQIMNHGFPIEKLFLFLAPFKDSDLVESTETSVPEDSIYINVENKIESNEEALYKHISGTFNGNDVAHNNYGSAGLCTGDENNRVLFSRLTFNKVAITANKTYTFEYYIYF